MDSLFILIPVTFLLLGTAIAAWVWSVRSGQYDDLDKAARSILFDDDENDRRDSPSAGPEEAE